jgi:hypothetical protein
MKTYIIPVPSDRAFMGVFGISLMNPVILIRSRLLKCKIWNLALKIFSKP